MVTFLKCSLANPSVGQSLNFISPKLRCFVWKRLYLSNQAHSRAPSSSSSHPQSSPGPPRQELSNTNSSNHLSLPDKLSFVLQLRPIFVCVLVFVPVVFIIMFKAFHDRLVLFLELFTIWSCAASAVLTLCTTNCPFTCTVFCANSQLSRCLNASERAAYSSTC